VEDVDFPENKQGTWDTIGDGYMVVGICVASGGHPAKMATFEVMVNQKLTHEQRMVMSAYMMGIYDSSVGISD